MAETENVTVPNLETEIENETEISIDDDIKVIEIKEYAGYDIVKENNIVINNSEPK